MSSGNCDLSGFIFKVSGFYCSCILIGLIWDIPKQPSPALLCPRIRKLYPQGISWLRAVVKRLRLQLSGRVSLACIKPQVQPLAQPPKKEVYRTEHHYATIRSMQLLVKHWLFPQTGTLKVGRKKAVPISLYLLKWNPMNIVTSKNTGKTVWYGGTHL